MINYFFTFSMWKLRFKFHIVLIAYPIHKDYKFRIFLSFGGLNVKALIQIHIVSIAYRISELSYSAFIRNGLKEMTDKLSSRELKVSIRLFSLMRSNFISYR